MQDRVGDFLTTGGGPMKDFFDTIAPKVGVTAEQFRKLSGPDALQLFYTSLERAGLSQSEMTFFMEAMASDATGLIPLLRENGKAFDELGKKASVITPEQIAQFKAYNAAQLQMEQSTQKLTIALVSSGLLEGITSLVTKAADFTAELSRTNPGLLQTGMVIAGVLAAIGPLLMALGMMTTGFGTLLAALPAISTGFTALSTAMAAARVASLGLLPALAPFLIPLAAIAAAVGLVYLAWQNWDTIKAVLDKVWAAISGWWTGSVQPVLTAIGEAVKKVVQIFADYFGAQLRRIVEGVSALLRGDFAGAWRAAEGFVTAPIRAALAAAEAFVPGVTGAFQRLYSGVKEWLQDKLASVFEWFTSRIDAIRDTVSGLFGDRTVAALVANVGVGGVILDAGDGPPPAVDVPVDAPLPMTGESAGPDMSMPDEAEKSWRDGFRRAVSAGMRAALDGDLGEFFTSWISQGASRGLEMAFDAVADVLGSLLRGLGSGGGGIGGILSSLFAGGFATGGLIPSGKFGVVGERGPELAIASPSGTLIRPNASLSNMSLQPGGSGPQVSIPISIDATGADPAALARVRAELRTLRAELPQQIVRTVQDAGERRIINPGTWR